MRRNAFTLVELLAVAALVGLVASVALVATTGVTAASRTMRVTAELRDLDGRARLLARNVGGAVLEVDTDTGAVVVTAHGDDEPALRVPLPEGFSARIVDTDGSSSIAIDPNGRSTDYAVELRHPRGTIRWTIGGLTGQLQPAVDERGTVMP